MRRKKYITAHPVNSEADQYYMCAKEHYREFVVAKLAQNARGERDQTYKHEEKSVYIYQPGIQIFRVNGNEEMLRAPVGEEQSKGKHIAHEHGK